MSKSKSGSSTGGPDTDAFAAGEERLVAPALDPKFFEGMEKFATGAEGFARTDEGDVICGILLGQHAKLECAYIELEHPCVVSNGKDVDNGHKEWLAKAGAVVNMNLHYATAPVLMEERLIGKRVIVTIGKEESIGKGKTLKHFDVRLPEGAPRPKLATRQNGAAASLPADGGQSIASERALARLAHHGAAWPPCGE